MALLGEKEMMTKKNKGKSKKNGLRKSIPPAVQQILRQEVGFGCPVKGCSNPYLEYHHFDPPVSVRAHNEPSGMIALCAQHHRKADGGAFTVEQLHRMKSDRVNAELVKGELDWLRRELLAVVGGNYYHETPRIFVLDDMEVVVLNRDEDGYLRLNACIPSLTADSRMKITNSSWDRVGSPIDLRSPPQGKELEVKYSNGDYLYLRFHDVLDVDELCKKYGDNLRGCSTLVNFPLTVLEVNLEIAGTGISLTPERSDFGPVMMKGCFSSRSSGAVVGRTAFEWGGRKRKL